MDSTTASISPHLTPSEFLRRLPTLFARTNGKDHGSVFLTQKRLSPHSLSGVTPSAAKQSALSTSDADPTHTYSILLHATLTVKSPTSMFIPTKAQPFLPKSEKEKIKLSTVVTQDEMESFFIKYAEICKTGMHGSLRKREKRKKRKGKSKKEGTATPAAASKS